MTLTLKTFYQYFILTLTALSKDAKDEEPVTMDTDFLQADWLQELPEDLDMLIAQRNFEGAVDTVEKGEQFEKEKNPLKKKKSFLFLLLFFLFEHRVSWPVGRTLSTVTQWRGFNPQSSQSGDSFSVPPSRLFVSGSLFLGEGGS